MLTNSPFLDVKNGEFSSFSILFLYNEIMQFILNKLKPNWLKKS